MNPDAAVLALWTAILLAGVRLLVDGMTPMRLAALGMLVAALLAVKPTGLAILPAALFAAGVAIRRRLDRPVRRRTGALLLVGAALVAAPLVALTTRRLERPLVSGGESLWELPGYLAQFYTPLAAPFDEANRWIVIRILTLDHSIPASLAPALVMTLAIAAAVSLVAARAAVPRAVIAFCALAGAGLMAGVHWTEFKSLTEGRGAFTQPRYLLPLAPLAGPADRGRGVPPALALAAGCNRNGPRAVRRQLGRLASGDDGAQLCVTAGCSGSRPPCSSRSRSRSPRRWPSARPWRSASAARSPGSRRSSLAEAPL